MAETTPFCRGFWRETRRSDGRLFKIWPGSRVRKWPRNRLGWRVRDGAPDFSSVKVQMGSGPVCTRRSGHPVPTRYYCCVLAASHQEIGLRRPEPPYSWTQGSTMTTESTSGGRGGATARHVSPVWCWPSRLVLPLTTAESKIWLNTFSPSRCPTAGGIASGPGEPRTVHMHTTISVLEGLLEYETGGGRQVQRTRLARERAHEFLYIHQMFRSHRTGKTIDDRMTRFSFPPQWHYDVLRGLDYLKAAKAPKDSRLGASIELVKKRRIERRKMAATECVSRPIPLCHGATRSTQPVEHSPSLEGAPLVG